MIVVSEGIAAPARESLPLWRGGLLEWFGRVKPGSGLNVSANSEIVDFARRSSHFGGEHREGKSPDEPFFAH